MKKKAFLPLSSKLFLIVTALASLSSLYLFSTSIEEKMSTGSNC